MGKTLKAIARFGFGGHLAAEGATVGL